MKMLDIVSWFQENYPHLVHDMTMCNHHYNDYDMLAPHDNYSLTNLPVKLNPYHLEGNTFTHTMMVCKQLDDDKFPKVLKLAGLLHDIGKPDCRKVNPTNNYVSFMNHDPVSAFKALEILKHHHFGLQPYEIADAFYAIALHTQMFKLNNEQLNDLFVNMYTIYDLTHKLSIADSAGRFSDQSSTLICPIYRKSFGSSDIQTKQVTVLVGLPCSGKSTWLKQPSQKRYVVSRDSIIQSLNPELSYNESWKLVDQNEVDKELQKQFKESLNYDNVVVDMTHMSKKSRRKTLSHYPSTYRKKAVLFLTDLPTIYDRNEKRQGKHIPTSVIQNMMESFFPPMYSEGFDDIEVEL